LCLFCKKNDIQLGPLFYSGQICVFLYIDIRLQFDPCFVQETSTFFLIENAFALFLVLLVNVAIVSITGTICANNQSVDDIISTCSGLTLNSTSVLLKVSISHIIVQHRCKLQPYRRILIT